jgi:hypothetical protein
MDEAVRRKALKKARAALRLPAGEKLYALENSKLRELGEIIAVRDAAVLVETFDEVAEDRSSGGAGRLGRKDEIGRAFSSSRGCGGDCGLAGGVRPDEGLAGSGGWRQCRGLEER